MNYQNNMFQPDTYIKKNTKENPFSSDILFDNLYPVPIQILSKQHWTPIDTAVKVANFLAGEEKESILDIGSGVGKFCLIAAHHTPNAVYYGIEQRKSLIKHANEAKTQLGLDNVSFIHGNFTQLDFKKFHHFYFYNSFYENLPGTDKIDDSIDYSDELYVYYKRYLFRQLELKPKGTRLCTLCTWDHEIPQEYHIVGSDMSERLKFWVKV
jgi:SAM-dependent methyltransferase